MPRHTLPEEIGFSFRVGEARRAGVRRARLDAPDLERIFHGGRVQRERFHVADGEAPWVCERHDLERRIAAYLPLLPEGAFFTGPTAAHLWEAPLPLGMHDRLHVAVHHPRTAPLRAGIRGVQVLWLGW